MMMMGGFEHGAAATASSGALGCSLARGELCGGVSYCGADRDCAPKGCCAGVLACRRGDELTWRCQ
jgi:hypothetical protein